MNTSSPINTPIFFGLLNDTVEKHFGVKLGRKEAAIALSAGSPAGLSSAGLIRDLRQSLEGEWWKSNGAARGRNWHWRDAKTLPLAEPSRAVETGSKEVQLERAIATLTDARSDWTYQMSTASGLRGQWTDKRRAIDLVRRLDGGGFRFIELKVDSNNPVYALFEILGYGLAYLLARQHGIRGSGKHDVMDASRIELEVLAPQDWYTYKPGRRAEPIRFKLEWLIEAVNDGLRDEVSSLGLDGLESMTLGFRCYQWLFGPEETATEIVRSLSGLNQHNEP